MDARIEEAGDFESFLYRRCYGYWSVHYCYYHVTDLSQPGLEADH